MAGISLDTIIQSLGVLAFTFAMINFKDIKKVIDKVAGSVESLNIQIAKVILNDKHKDKEITEIKSDILELKAEMRRLNRDNHKTNTELQKIILAGHYIKKNNEDKA